MGVQVGNYCFSTQLEAENYLFSQFVPVANYGGLLQPVFNGNTWTFAGQPISANLPACSQFDNFADGSVIGWTLVLVMASAWTFKIIGRML